MKRSLILILFISAFSFIQFLNVSFFGVKPNFAIAAVVAASFFIFDVWEGVFLIALASFILKFSPYLDNEIFIFFIIGILVILTRKYLPWHHLINNLFLTFAYTLIFYLLLFPNLIVSMVFFLEVIYNILIGFAVFLILTRITPKRPSLL